MQKIEACNAILQVVRCNGLIFLSHFLGIHKWKRQYSQYRTGSIYKSLIPKCKSRGALEIFLKSQCLLLSQKSSIENELLGTHTTCCWHGMILMLLQSCFEIFCETGIELAIL